MLNRRRIADYSFILPAAMIYLVVIIIPAFYSLNLSFYKWNGVSATKQFVGILNYINLFKFDHVFTRAILNNVIWVLMTMTVTVTVAFSLALLLNRDFKGRSLFRGVFYFPYVLSAVMVAIIWTWVYHTQLGLVSGLMKLVNLDHLYRSPIANTETALLGAFAAALWQGAGAPMVLFLAGLKTIPHEMYEAATIDGAGRFQILTRITIPMLRETFVIVFATQIISAMKVYDLIIALTAGGPAHRTQTMATWMVQQTFTFAKVGNGTAIAVLMVLILMVVIIPFVLFMAKDQER